MNKHRWYFAAALTLVLLSTLYGLQWSFEYATRFQDITMKSVDQTTMVPALQRATWASVPGWFAGPWFNYPQTVFFRPIPSVLFWMEWQLFGPSKDAFLLVTWLSHAAVMVLGFLFLRRLFGDLKAGVAVAIWATSATSFLGLPTVLMTPASWLNCVELWFSMAAFLFLIVAHKYLQTEERRWFHWTVVALVGAIFVKEMAYMLPILFALLAWHERKLHLWRRWWPMAVAVVTCLLYRTWALGGTGQHFGSNRSWFVRWAISCVAGRPAAPAVSGLDLACIAAALLLAAVGLLLTGRWRGAGMCIGGAVLSAGITDYAWAGTWGDTALRLMSGTVYHDAVLALIIGLSFWYLYSTRERDMVFGYCWVLLSYLPLFLTTTGDQTLYLPCLGWGIWFAVPITRGLELAWARCSTQRPGRVAPEPVAAVAP